MMIRTIFHWLVLEEMQTGLSAARLFSSLYSFLDYGIMSYLLNLLVSYSYFFYNRFRERELMAAQLQAELVQAQLQTLKMQLHPHFLFNTLNTITVLIRKNENARAIRMITDLGSLLRHSMNSLNVHEVPLRQEIDLLKLYLAIELVRFKDRLTVEFDLAPESLSAGIPYLILQPLVENSVKHGISQVTRPGKIIISSAINGDKLIVSIIDDGPGINGERDQLIHKGIGISNTVSRLKKLYGDEGCFELLNNPGGGTSAILEIPFKEFSSETYSTEIPGADKSFAAKQTILQAADEQDQNHNS